MILQNYLETLFNNRGNPIGKYNATDLTNHSYYSCYYNGDWRYLKYFKDNNPNKNNLYYL